MTEHLKARFRYESRTRWLGHKIGRLVVEKAHRLGGYWIARCQCGRTVRTTGERLSAGGAQCCPECHRKNWLQGAARKLNQAHRMPTLKDIWNQ